MTNSNSDDVRLLARDKALKRAHKFEKLFKGDCFESILNAASAQDENAFRTACKSKNIPGGELEDTEVAWLWNYLQHMDDKWKDVPDVAANTGW